MSDFFLKKIRQVFPYNSECQEWEPLILFLHYVCYDKDGWDLTSDLTHMNWLFFQNTDCLHFNIFISHWREKLRWKKKMKQMEDFNSKWNKNRLMTKPSYPTNTSKLEQYQTVNLSWEYNSRRHLHNNSWFTSTLFEKVSFLLVQLNSYRILKSTLDSFRRRHTNPINDKNHLPLSYNDTGFYTPMFHAEHLTTVIYNSDFFQFLLSKNQNLLVLVLSLLANQLE